MVHVAQSCANIVHGNEIGETCPFVVDFVRFDGAMLLFS